MGTFLLPSAPSARRWDSKERAGGRLTIQTSVVGVCRQHSESPRNSVAENDGERLFGSQTCRGRASTHTASDGAAWRLGAGIIWSFLTHKSGGRRLLPAEMPAGRGRSERGPRGPGRSCIAFYALALDVTNWLFRGGHRPARIQEAGRTPRLGERQADTPSQEEQADGKPCDHFEKYDPSRCPRAPGAAPSPQEQAGSGEKQSLGCTVPGASRWEIVQSPDVENCE